MFTTRHRIGFRLIATLVATVIFFSLSGCGKNKTGKVGGKAKPPEFTDEELAEGFVVTMLSGSNVIRMGDGVDIGQPPYDFFLTITNPDDTPRQVQVTTSPAVDLKIISGEDEVFRYSNTRGFRDESTMAEIRERNKKAWQLKWNGLLEDKTHLPEGSYTLIFTLNTRPPMEHIAHDVRLSFPVPEEPDITGDAGSGISIRPGWGSVQEDIKDNEDDNS